MPSVPTDSPVVIHCSVDTLYFSISGDLHHGVPDALHMAREMAEEAGAPIASPWIYEDMTVMLRHHGWFSYGYWLTCEAFDFMVSTQDKLPAVFVQVRQTYLYEVGDPQACYRRVVDWVSRWFFDKVDKAVVSRIDLCADVLGWPKEYLDPTRYTTRAHEWRMRGERDAVTGLEWGVRGSPCFVRLYDKTLEAYVHRKTWMELLWIPAGWDPGEKEPIVDRYGEVKRNKDGSIRMRWKRPPDKVTRLEFELRGEFLDRFAKDGDHKALKTPEDVLKNVGHIWQYLLGQWMTDSNRTRYYVGWLVPREPTEGANKTRWPPPPWWDKMASEGLKQARLDQIVRRQQDLIDAEALLRQAAGCIAQRAAILGDTTLIEAAQDFAREWLRLLEGKGTTFKQVVEAKREQKGIKRRPLEKPATAAANKDVEGGAANVGGIGVAGSVERGSGESGGPEH